MSRHHSFFVLLAGFIVTGLSIVPTDLLAQPSINRTVQRAVATNIRTAMERLQLSLKVRGGAGKVVFQDTSGNGRYLLLVFEDNRPRVWDLEKGRYWDQFEALTSPIVAAAINGNMGFTTVQADGSVARWSADSTTPVRREATSLQGVAALALRRTGELLIVDSAGRVRTYRDTLRDLGSAYADLSVSADPIAMDPSGDVFVTPVSETVLRLWSSRTGAPIADIPLASGVSAFAYGEESGELFVAAGDTVLLWDTRVARETLQYQCPGACDFKRLLINPATRSLIGVREGGELLRWPIDSNNENPQALSSTRGLASIRTSAGAPVLIGGTSEGRIRFSHLERPDSELTLVSTSRGWAMIDPAGRFDGQAGDNNGISWSNDSIDFPLPSFVDTHFEPGLFRTWLRSDTDFMTDPTALSDGVLRPPRVEMTLLPPRLGEPEKFIEVRVKLTDQGGGLGELSLYHLGLRVGPEKRVDQRSFKENGSAVAQSTWRVRALPGENSFTARVRDSDGVVAPGRIDSVQVDGLDSDPALHLLAISIDDYGDEQLNLNYSNDDADAVMSHLASQSESLFSNIYRTDVRNESATREGVIKALKELQKAEPEDVVVIYAATHGEVFNDQFHLLLQGLRAPVTRRRMKSVGLPFNSIARQLEQLDARRVILLLDTCKSGDALMDQQSEFRDRRALQSYSNLLGVHMIAATAKGQLATESSVLGHGVFTYSLIDGLGGKADRAPRDGLLTATELARFTEAGVPALSARYADFPQWPTVYSMGFDFGVARTGTDSSAPTPEN